MAGYDISRRSSETRKHYASVRMQQGRVLTDDDWNTNEALENEERRRSRVDVIGAFGSPDAGFRIENLRFPEGKIDFDIHQGSLHLGGLRLEMDEPESYRLQKDWLQGPPEVVDAPAAADLSAENTDRFDLVYIEAWQQPVSAVEDEELFEEALGGPDTTTRIRNMRRVRLASDIGFGDCARAWRQLTDHWENVHSGRVNEEYERVTDTRLLVSFTEEGVSDDLCTPSFNGGYLGAENQAIRVQLTGPDTFTWGFDNAAPLYRVEVSGDTVHFLTTPKDQHHWPLAGQTVEILPWSAVLPNGEKVAAGSGYLTRVAGSYDPDREEMVLGETLPPGLGMAWQSRTDAKGLRNQAPAEYFYLRVWNRGMDLTSPEKISFQPDVPVALGHTGLAVTISGQERVADDYWVIAARPETPHRVVPWQLYTESMPPHGSRRFYAPLAVIRWTLDDNGGLTGEITRDCRKIFQPLTDLESCCTYTVGDGLHSKGDFNSIAEALRHLPESGGKICVLAGEHLANVRIAGRRQIRISGCGEHTIVRPHPDRLSEPIFRLENAQEIQIDQLSLIAADGTAVELEDVDKAAPPSRGIAIRDNRIVACRHALHIRVREDVGGDNDIHIANNRIGMIDKEEGEVAIFVLADDVLIERNRLVVVPAPAPDDPDDPRGNEDPPGGVFDPCADPKKFYALRFPLQLYLKAIFNYVNNVFVFRKRLTYKTLGGIQIGGTSERVRIIDNEIIGGRGNGVTLGHLQEVVVEGPPPPEEEAFTKWERRSIIVNKWSSEAVKAAVVPTFFNILYDVTIAENQIRHMGLSGIGAAAFFNGKKIGLAIEVKDLTVYRNTITRCAQQTPSGIPEEMLGEVGYGGVSLAAAENAMIQENRIEENGVSHLVPCCGIFILQGERIDISNNRIINNGPRTSQSDVNALTGERDGIVVKLAAKFGKKAAFDTEENSYPDGIPAIKVHGNIVVQPMGRALSLCAYGPVSVVGNQLTSQGRDARDATSAQAGVVFIYNLGVSKDYLRAQSVQKFQYTANTNFVAAKARASTQPPSRGLLYTPSGAVMFSNNQVVMDMTSPERTVVTNASMIVSLDDIGCEGNQFECASTQSFSKLATDVAVNNVFLVGMSVRASNNRFQEGFSATKYSLFSYGHMNTALGNQATHCLHVLGALRQSANNLVLLSSPCGNDLISLAARMKVSVAEYAAART